MNREALYTLAIYAILIALAATSWAGLALAAGWLGVGAWMVWRTRSRGLLALARRIAVQIETERLEGIV